MSLISAEAAQKQIREQAAALRAYAGTDMYEHLVKLLQALRASYMYELADVKPEQLQFKQAALKQVTALERSLDSDVTSPRI